MQIPVLSDGADLITVTVRRVFRLTVFTSDGFSVVPFALILDNQKQAAAAT
jgi:hypothetical protein